MNENELMINIVKEQLKELETNGFVFDVVYDKKNSEIVAEFKHENLVMIISATIIIEPKVVVLLCESLKNTAFKINEQLKIGFDNPLKFKIIARSSENNKEIFFSTYGDYDPHSLEIKKIFPSSYYKENDNENL